MNGGEVEATVVNQEDEEDMDWCPERPSSLEKTGHSEFQAPFIFSLGWREG